MNEELKQIIDIVTEGLPEQLHPTQHRRKITTKIRDTFCDACQQNVKAKRYFKHFGSNRHKKQQDKFEQQILDDHYKEE